MKTIHTFVRIIVDAIFPPSKERLLIRNISEKDTYNLYEPNTQKSLITLVKFANPKISALIHEAKFHNNRNATKILGKLLCIHFEQINLKDTVIVIPIPLSKARLKARGYNQVSEIIKIALKNTDIKMNEKILKRWKNTIPQTKLSREERLTNINGAFLISNAEKIKNKHIILIDDVLTTGATLLEAKATLSLHFPASITCIAIAH